MRRLIPGLAAATVVAALTAVLQPVAGAAVRGDSPVQSDAGSSGSVSASHRSDNRPGPLTKRQDAQRRAAVDKLVKGRATKAQKAGGGSTVTLASGKSVEFFDNKKQARILSILSDFGDQTVGKYGGTAGPVHNQIPKPSSDDNSTIWTSNFDRAHYDQMFNGSGESFRSFYKALSNGQYTADGTVEDWVKVPYNAAYYGANPREDEGGAWDFIQDTGNAWYQKQLSSGKSAADIDAYLSQFDQWDRYDYDHDGNFNEPDGYIDHFQAIHAGEGEEAGAPADAIWSHRWYVDRGYGTTGPSVAGANNLLGGARIGSSSYYIGDYTVEPENGGLGVFAHEYGHDLGLPDFYDTDGGENGTAFWTLMSSGSWLNHGDVDQDGDGVKDGIGTTPGYMGPDERMFLGWLDYATATPGATTTATLRPSAATTATSGTKQAVVVPLADKSTTSVYTTPPEGTHAWYSGRGDNLSTTLSRSVPAASSVTVTASTWYQIEDGYDYLFGEYSLDNGKTWSSAGAPLTGATKSWSGARWSYKAGNQPSLFRFRYKTDGGVNEAGAFLDAITVKAGNTTVLTDGAENGANGWTATGWKVSTGTESQTTPQYYLLENRAYVGYDSTLRTGPYQFDAGYTKPNHVELFPFQDGLLVWFADKAYADNNTSSHPGHGQALPVDARPTPFTYPDGTMPSNRRQPFDATFGLQPTDDVCLHKEVLAGTKQNPTAKSVAACAYSSPGIATFNDQPANRYWSSADPQNSTLTANSGVKATVTGQSGDQLTVSVVNPKG